MENIEKNIDLEESRRILMDSGEEVNYSFFLKSYQKNIDYDQNTRHS